MPKSTKAAPPQQASLQDIWGKKKVDKTTTDPKAEPKIESEAMDVDLLQEQTGIMNKLGLLRVLISVEQLGLLNARNQLLQAVRPYQFNDGVFLISRFVASPKVKKRRILDSDDEIDPNDLPSLPNSRSSTPTSEM
jgi:DNA ligase-1